MSPPYTIHPSIYFTFTEPTAFLLASDPYHSLIATSIQPTTLQVIYPLTTLYPFNYDITHFVMTNPTLP